MGDGISDLIRYTNGFKLLFYFYVILFIVFDICSTYFICNMLDVNRILKLYFILSENKKTKLLLFIWQEERKKNASYFGNYLGTIINGLMAWNYYRK